MAATAGKDGVIKLAKVKIGYIDNWSLAINQGTSETSQMGTDWKEHIATAKDWSGSLSGTLDYADPSQKKIVDMLIKGTPIEDCAVELFCGATLSLTGAVIFTSCSITAAHADKIAVSLNFQGTGALSVSEAI